MCIHHILFTHFSLNGHVGCFQSLAIVKNAATHMGMHKYFLVTLLPNLSGGYLGEKWLDRMTNLLQFLSNRQTVFHDGCAVSHPRHSARGFRLHILIPCFFLGFVSLLVSSPPRGCEVDL